MSLFLKLVAYQFAASVLGTQVDPDSSPERNAAALFFGIVRTGAQDELLASQKRQLTVFSQLDIFYQVVLCDEPSPASTAPAAPCINDEDVQRIKAFWDSNLTRIVSFVASSSAKESEPPPNSCTVAPRSLGRYYHRWFHWKLGVENIKQYETRRGSPYKAIIFTRPDLFFQNPLPLTLANMKRGVSTTLKYQGRHVSDTIFVADRDSAAKLANITQSYYNCWTRAQMAPYLGLHDPPANGHALLHLWLSKEKVSINGLNVTMAGYTRESITRISRYKPHSVESVPQWPPPPLPRGCEIDSSLWDQKTSRTIETADKSEASMSKCVPPTDLPRNSAPDAARCSLANYYSRDYDYYWNISRCACQYSTNCSHCCRQRRSSQTARQQHAPSCPDVPFLALSNINRKRKNDGKMQSPRFAIYTISTNGVDIEKSRPEFLQDSGIDYYYFVDALGLETVLKRHPPGVSAWKIVQLNETVASGEELPLKWKDRNIHLSRMLKICQHRNAILADYDKSIYIDGNVNLVQPPTELFDYVDAHDPAKPDIALWFFHRSVQAEGEYIRSYLTGRLGLKHSDDLKNGLRNRIEMQVDRYVQSNFELVMNNLTGYGKVLVRAHGERTSYFNEVWWREFAGGVPRDQLSLAWSIGKARSEVNLSVHELQVGPGERRCRCAADDRRFQQFFVHMGRGGHP